MSLIPSRTIRTGLKIAESQGLKGNEAEAFAMALDMEYYMQPFTEAVPFLDAMEDFELKKEDDFIIGTVRSNVADGPELTRIISSEKLPKKFSGAEVEIRLKKIEKPPMKDEVEGVLMKMCCLNEDESRAFEFRRGGPAFSIPFVNGVHGLHTAVLSKYEGKKVKITIEEVKE